MRMCYCDYCGENMFGVKSRINSIDSDKDDFWNECYKKLKEERLSKIKSKFKLFWYKIFYTPDMPFYKGEYGVDFCDINCYSQWKTFLELRIKDAKRRKNA